MNDIFEKHFKEQGFTEPTLIQKEVYPLLAQGKDVLGLSPTGSGKTLAYALPLLEKVLKGDGPQLLIIAPSQELAAQLADVIRPWGKLLEIKTAAIIGGANVKRQIEKLRKDRPEVIVGTPGRLLNLADEKRLKLHNLEAIVIDEADEMLAQEETLADCRKLVSRAKADVQLGFFSATKTPVLNELHKWFGIEPITCDVRKQDQTRGHVTHYMVEVPQRKRVEALRKLANVKDFHALVFFKQNAELKDAYEKLIHAGASVARLSSEQRQTEREKALNGLKKRQIRLVLTTDVACRGLDIQKLPAVVNFDLPKDDLRKFKQLIKDENYEIETGYIFNQELTTEKNVETVRPQKLKKSVGKTAEKVEKQLPTAKKHKKKRKRDQKDKGKRKVKKA